METLIYVGLGLIILALAFITINEHKAFKFQKQVNDDLIKEQKEIKKAFKESKEKIDLLEFRINHKPAFEVGEKIGNLKVMSVTTELSNDPFNLITIAPFMGLPKLGIKHFCYEYKCYNSFKNKTKRVSEDFLLQLRDESKVVDEQTKEKQ